MQDDNFLTLVGESEGLYKDKGSKFIAISRHVETEEEFTEFLKEVKKKYYDARHHCYAWRLSPEEERYRANDDGEPSGTAGKPILNQLLSKELFYSSIIVVRYFGGTKLGVSGLINAYKSSSREALENAKIVKKFIYSTLELKFDYPRLNDVMRLIKDNDLKLDYQKMEMNCLLRLLVKKNEVKFIINKLALYYDVNVKVL